MNLFEVVTVQDIDELVPVVGIIIHSIESNLLFVENEPLAGIKSSWVTDALECFSIDEVISE